MSRAKVQVLDAGVIDYAESVSLQESYFTRVVEQKLQFRNAGQPAQALTENFLIFCEHPHVFTLGKSGDAKNLVVPQSRLSSIHARYYTATRGGDITYHGPGQLVVYPVFNLDNFFTDIHLYLRALEESVILTLAEYGIQAGRLKDRTGVWLDAGIPHKARKICAMGVRCSRWVTMHGIGFNINTDLSYFQYIIPCGIPDKAVTSLQKEINHAVPMDEVKQRLLLNMANIFDFHFVTQ